MTPQKEYLSSWTDEELEEMRKNGVERLQTFEHSESGIENSWTSSQIGRALSTICEIQEERRQSKNS